MPRYTRKALFSGFCINWVRFQIITISGAGLRLKCGNSGKFFPFHIFEQGPIRMTENKLIPLIKGGKRGMLSFKELIIRLLHIQDESDTESSTPAIYLLISQIMDPIN